MVRTSNQDVIEFYQRLGYKPDDGLSWQTTSRGLM